MGTQVASRARVGVIGNFAGVSPAHNGQTLRTRMLYQQLAQRLGPTRVDRADTAVLPRDALEIALAIIRMFRRCDVLLLMPGERGLYVLLPLLLLLRALYRRPLHYVVVGGWLPGFLAVRPWLRRAVTKLDSLHVQSLRMQSQLRAQGCAVVYQLPNFRDFVPAPPSSPTLGPLRLVFLSRLIPDKGIQPAVEAVRKLNRVRGEDCVRLDIYGPVPKTQRSWFAELALEDDPALAWHGAIPQIEVVETLAGHDALLFPTWYDGEGFPGVVVEAFAAGVPVLASDWQDNAEVVAHERSGMVFPVCDDAALRAAIARLLDEPGLLERLKAGARHEARRYHVDVVIPPFLERLRLSPE